MTKWPLWWYWTRRTRYRVSRSFQFDIHRTQVHARSMFSGWIRFNFDPIRLFGFNATSMTKTYYKPKLTNAVCLHKLKPNKLKILKEAKNAPKCHFSATGLDMQIRTRIGLITFIWSWPPNPTPDKRIFLLWLFYGVYLDSQRKAWRNCNQIQFNYSANNVFSLSFVKSIQYIIYYAHLLQTKCKLPWSFII